MDSQGEYEGQNFGFTSPDNMDNGGSQNLTKLTTANMEDMEEYYNFGKDTSSYTTPWEVMNRRTCSGFFVEGRRKWQSCCQGFWETLGTGFSFLVLASFQKSQNWRTLMGGQEGDALQRRRFSSVAESRDTETVDAGQELLFWDYHTQRLSPADSQICMLCVCISYLKKKRKDKQLQSHQLHLMW